MTVEQLHVHRGNRAEHLVDALYEVVRPPLSSPFQKELIVVQGQGMAIWLNMQLSRRAGVWANTDYLYPKHFIERIFEIVLEGKTQVVSARERYSPESLLWTIAARLPALLEDPAFESLLGYVGQPTDENRLFLLSAKIADTFDEYLTFRPELVRLWGKSDEHFEEPQLDLFQQSHSSDPAIWQRKLWRDVESVLGSRHASGSERRYHTALTRRKNIPGLPERVCLFGLSTLPPMYIRALAALSRHVPVHLFLHSPTREYFGDILLDRAPRALTNDGNRLIRSLAPLVAEFNQVVTETCESLGVQEVEHTHYVEPESASLLHHVQRDLLAFNETKAPDLRADGSIVVHSCHSPIREVEVLHDQILHLVHVEGIRPDDILVLLPDVEAYAPLLDAVFRRDDERFLPYRIADRQADAESAVVKSFLRVLDLVSERITSAQVMDLLSLPPVRTRFDLESLDLPVITEWLVQSHVTWGMNATHRMQEVGHAISETTWRAGLDRLLLGYTVDTAGEKLVCGIYPYEHIEGKTAQLLGNFVRFTTVLFRHLEELAAERLPQAWQRSLTQLLDELILVSRDEYWQKHWILEALESLATLSQQAGYTQAVSIQVVRRLLNNRLEQQGAARGFLAGGITMSALIPMRSVPFQVVCIVGMNDDAFPRDAHRTDFNLLEHGDDKRRFGDPNRRLDDRYLFLEALASARSRFVVTYVGQSVRDNSARSPSVVVSELLDAIEGCAQDPKQFIGLVIQHPLQPFSPRYFNGSDARLHSYAEEFIPELGEPESAADAFLETPLKPEPPPDVLPIAELVSFFRSPTRYLLERRLKVRFQEQLVTLQEHDVTDLGPLESYQVGAPLLSQVRRGLSVQESLALARARGALPPGQLGRYEFQQLEYTALSLAEMAEELGSNGTPRNHHVSLECGGYRIEGVIPDLYPSGRVHLQFGRINGRVMLRMWLEHLLVAATCEANSGAQNTWVLGREGKGEEAGLFQFLPVEQPLPLLVPLLELYKLGCTLPVPLFPDISYEFAAAKEPRATSRFSEAWKELLTREAAVARVFGAKSRLRFDEPMLPAIAHYPLFETLSARVFLPLLEHRRKVERRQIHESV